MKPRSIKEVTYAHEFPMGPMRVKQPLPSVSTEQVSPFILLHHAGPDHYQPGQYKTRLGPHPHRGFEPVTFLFSGKIHHRDSLGNEGFLKSGDVQWMTAGSGIIHSEGPSEEFAKEGGTLELIQLWINLPRESKMAPPRYQDIPASSMPRFEENGVKMQLVAGNYKGQKGPASTFTNILAMMVEFEVGKEMAFDVPAEMNVMVYLLEGKLKSGETETGKLHLLHFNNDGDQLVLTAEEEGKLLLLAGEPIDEPMATYGPFVMNYPGELKQAVLDYETGKMGNLDF